MKTSKITTILLCIMAIISISSCATNNGKKENMPPKYIFLFIGDGMSYNNVALTESYLSYKSGKLGGEQLLFQFLDLGIYFLCIYSFFIFIPIF